MARDSDRGTFWLVLALVLPILFATAVTTCDGRERYRAETAAIRHRAGVDTKLDDLQAKLEQQGQLLTTGLGLLGLMIAVGGLLLPIWTHVATIAPGQRLLDDARQAIKEAREAKEGLRQQFAELAKAQRLQENDEAISRLLSTDKVERDLGLEYLIFRGRGHLTEPQIFGVTAAVRTATDEELKHRVVTLVLGDSKSPFVISLLGDLLMGPRGGSYLEVATEHCDLENVGFLQDRVRAFAQRRPNQLKVVLPTVMRNARQFGIALMNEAAWLEGFPLLERLHATDVLLGVPGWLEALRSSALFSATKGVHKLFSLHEADWREVGADESNVLLVYDDGRKAGHFREQSSEFREAQAAARSRSSA